MQRKGLDIFLLVLKILVPVVLIYYIVVCSIDLKEAYIADIERVCEAGEVCIETYGIAFAALFIISFIFDGAALVVSLLGLIISAFYKGSLHQKRNVVTFLLLAVASVASVFVLLGIYELIPSLVG